MARGKGMVDVDTRKFGLLLIVIAIIIFLMFSITNVYWINSFVFFGMIFLFLIGVWLLLKRK